MCPTSPSTRRTEQEERHGRGRTPRRRTLARPLRGLVCLVLAASGCATVARVATEDFVLVRSAVSPATIAVTLDRSFVERYADRVTIDVAFTVDKTDRRPHPAFIDGDFHVAGRAPGIGLPIVAEIENAASEERAMAAARRAAGTGRPIRLAGAWRLWAEHAGSAEEVQGEELSAIERTNPDHVFEVHPVTRIDGEDILESLYPPKGYGPASADRAFRSFENVKCSISPAARTITIVVPKGMINDAEFVMEVAGDGQHVVEDGRFVNAAVLDLSGKRLVGSARMAFVRGSPPERRVRGLRRGSRLHVFGLPRLDLSEVARRVRDSKSDPALLEGSLPYEIVVVGVYADETPGASRRTAPAGPRARAAAAGRVTATGRTGARTTP